MLTHPPQISARWIRQWVIVIVAAIATLLLSYLNTHPSFAQAGYPTAGDSYVNDYAQVLTAEEATSIRQAFAQLKAWQGVEAVVVTINSIQDYGTGDSTIESFATNLFNTWGIGDAADNNGILTLVAVGDREVRIEVGSGYGTSLDSAMQAVIDDYMVPRFKESDYSGGIRRGTEAIVAQLTNSETPSQPGVQSAYSPSPPSTVSPITETTQNHQGWWFIGGGATGLGGIGLGLQQYLRYRKRRCPDCGIQMVRLDEAADNQYLNEGQNAEERLGSVDYDVWQCPSCQTHDINRYGSLLSGYRTCPSCRYKTMQSNRQTLVRPTHHSTGTARITQTCRHCSYRNSRTIMLARLQDNNNCGSSSGGSSGGGSFGGGSSSGGGASGSW